VETRVGLGVPAARTCVPGAWDTALRRPVARTTFNTPDMFSCRDAEQCPRREGGLAQNGWKREMG
jgi:hypothetical protein